MMFLGGVVRRGRGSPDSPRVAGRRNALVFYTHAGSPMVHSSTGGVMSERASCAAACVSGKETKRTE